MKLNHLERSVNFKLEPTVLQHVVLNIKPVVILDVMVT